jgi:small redox-active disulfide protein 2
MDIKIYGHGCEKCTKTYHELIELLAEKGIEAEVEKIETLIDIYKAGVMTTPAIGINGRIVYAANAVPSRAKLEELLLTSL